MCPLCCRKLFFICRSTVLIFETSTVLSRRCKAAEFKRILVCRLHAVLCAELGNFQIYEGESNENLKSAIKIRNTVRLSCKLTTVILMV
jgi:hypothetical protein